MVNMHRFNLFNRFLSLFLSFVMILSLMPTQLIYAVSSSNGSSPGSIEIDATAEWTNTSKTEAMVNIDFSSISSFSGTNNATNFYFVVDASASLFGQRLTNVKSALKNSVSTILSMNTGNKIALISFSRKGNAMVETPTNSASQINSAIDQIATGEKASYTAGLNMVYDKLKNENEKNVIIFVTASGASSNEAWEIENSMEKLREKNVNTYVVQYMNGTNATDSVSNMESTVSYSPELNGINGAISEAIVNSVSTQNIEDISITFEFNNDFTFIPDSTIYSIGTTSFSGNTLTWTIPSIPSGVNTGLTFRVSPSDNLSGNLNIFTGRCSYTSPVNGAQSFTITSPELEKQGYSVTYDKGTASGTAPTDTNYYYPGETVYIKNSNLTNDSGYMFSGWHIKGDSSGNTITSAFIMPDENVILEPVWGKADILMGTGTIYVPPMLMAGSLKSKIPSYASITEVEFIDLEKVSAPNNSPINLGADENKPVYGYVVGTKLYIGGIGGVSANYDSSKMFKDFTSLQSIKGVINTSQVLSFTRAFQNCYQLRDISALQNWDTSNVRDFGMMFYMENSAGNTVLSDLSPLANWDTSNAVEMVSMFNNCKGLTNVDALSKWDTSNVTSFSGVIFDQEEGSVVISGFIGMFSGCSNLQNVNGLKNWNTSKVTNMDGMFYGCSELSNISGLSSWNMQSVQTANGMFSGCVKLGNIDALSSWRTPKLTGMIQMFKGCTSLQSISGMKNWGAIPKSLSGFVVNCSALLSSDGLQGLDVSGVTIFGSVTSVTEDEVTMDSIFFGCNSLRDLNAIKNWNVSNGTNFSGMFSTVPAVTSIDISNWNIRSDARLDYIISKFNNIPRTNNLTVYVKDSSIKNRLDATNQSGQIGYNDKVSVVVGSAPAMSMMSLMNEVDTTSYGNVALYSAPLSNETYTIDKSVVNGGKIEEGQEIIYWIAPMFYGDEGTRSGDISVVWKLPDEVTFNASKNMTFTLERINDDGKATMGSIVGNTIYYDNVNRLVTFTVTGLNAGTMLKVNVSCIAPMLNGASYKEIITNATSYYFSNSEISNNVFHYMGSSKDISKYNVSYEYSGDVPNLVPSLPQSMEYAVGSTVKIAESPILNGYIFSGWSVKSPSGTQISNGVITMPSSNVVLTGSWEEVTDDNQDDKPTSTITYQYSGEVPSGASKLPEAAEVANGEVYQIISNISDADGYWTFNGWTSSDLTSSQIENGSFVVDKDITLIGSWSKVKYTVRYEYINNVQNAPVLPASKEYEWGTLVTLENDLYDIQGYTFDGWFKDYDTDTPNTFTMPKNDVVIYGSYSEIAKSISFEFREPYPEGAELPATISDMYIGDTYTLPVLEDINGASFAGWSIKNIECGASISDNVLTVGNGDVRLIGTWANGEEIRVNFEWSGTVPPSAVFPTLPDYIYQGTKFNVGVISPNGYVFDGWTISPSGTGASISDNVLTVGNGDITLTGHWSRGAATNVTFEYTGSVPSGAPYPSIPGGQAYPSDVIDLDVTCPDGYRIASWTIKGDSDSQIQNLAPTNIDGITYYADNKLTVGEQDVTVVANWVRKGGSGKIIYKYEGDVPSNWPTEIEAPFKLGSGEKLYLYPTPPIPPGCSVTAQGLGGWSGGGEITSDSNGAYIILSGNSSDSYVIIKYKVTRVGTPVNLSFIFSGDVPAGVSPPAFTDPNFQLYDGSQVNVPAYENVRGYEFLGWSLKADGSGATWVKNTNDSGGVVTMGAKDATLVGSWRKVPPINISIVYEGQATVGPVTLPDQDWYSGDRITFPDLSQYDTDLFKFQGWSVKNPESGSIFTGNMLIVGSGDTVVVGKWTSPGEILLTFEWVGNPPDGLELPTVNGTLYQGQTVQLPAYGNTSTHKFLGWSIKTQGTGAILDGNNLTLGNKNLVIVGTWKQNAEIGIIFEYAGDIPNGLGLPTFPAGTVITEGMTVNISTLVPTYYKFLGWSIKDGTGAGSTLENTDLTQAKATLIPGASDVTLVGTFELLGSKVTYKYINAPAGAQVLPSEQIYNRGETINLPVVSPVENYEFKGWKITTPPSGVSIDDNQITLNAKEIVITGEWVKKPTITYTYADGSPVNAPSLPSNSSAYVGDNVQFATTPELRKYVFNGWKVISPDNVSVNENSFVMPDSPVIIEGSWTELEKTVTFEMDGDIPEEIEIPENKSGYIGDMITLPQFNNIEGYEFSGWQISGDAHGAYISGDILYLGSDDITVVGSWETKKYEVNYTYANTINGAPYLPTTKVYKFGETVTLADIPIHDRYIMKNWQIVVPSGLVIENNSFKMPNENVSIIGVWEPKKYNVEYRYEGKIPENTDELPQTELHEVDSEISVPNVTVPEGYIFSGWIPETPSTLGIIDGKFIMPNEPVVLVGTWEKSSNSVIYSYEGILPSGAPELPGGLNKSYGEKVYLFEVSDLPDYHFSGWEVISPENLEIKTDENGKYFIMPNESVILHGTWNDLFYNVKFQWAEDGPDNLPALPSESRVEVGSKFTLETDFYVDGWTFTGWTVVSPKDLSIDENSFTMPAQDVLLQGNWKIISYNVIYQYKNAPIDAPTLPSQKAYSFGENVIISSIPSLEKYTFDGWNLVSPENLIINDNSFTMPSSDVIFDGVWVKNSFNVSFEYTDGAPVSAPILPETKKYEVDEIVNLTTPTMTGYTFSGWNVKTPSELIIQDNQFIMPNEEVVLTGSWEINENTVTYIYEKAPSNAPELPTVKKYAYGEEVSVVQFLGDELPGYDFSDWYVLGPDGKEITLRNGRFTMPDGPVTITGSWTKGMYAINYEYEVGHPENVPNLPVRTMGEAGTKITLAEAPVYDGWVFSGWKITSPTGVNITDNQFTMPNEEVTITGTWTRNSYTVTYKYLGTVPENAPELPNQTTNLFEEIINVAETPKLAGHTFSGWRVQSGGITIDENGQFLMPANNVVLIGEWDSSGVKTYNVTFTYLNTPDGAPAVPPVTSYAYDAEVQMPIPTLENYTFSGWTVVSPTKPVINDNKFNMPAGDVVFEGSWELNEHKVTYIYTGNVPDGAPGVPNEETFKVGDTVSLHATPNFTGWTFSGWSVEGAVINGHEFIMPDNDVVISGSWNATANSYELKYSFTGDIPESAILPAAQNLHYGDKVSIPIIEPIYGYTFKGWVVPQNINVVENEFNMPDENVEIVGQWVKNIHSVKYEYEGEIPEGVPDVPTEIHYETGDIVTVHISDNASKYAFSGWTVKTPSNLVINEITNEFEMPDEDVVFVGHWSLSEYGVTYEYKEGTEVPDSAPALPSYEKHGATTTVTIATPPSIPGYTFHGWTISSPEGITVINNEFDMPESDVVISGYWTRNGDTKYTVNHYLEVSDGVYSDIPDKTEEFFVETLEKIFAKDHILDFPLFVLDKMSVENILVQPDGTSTINIYYKRASYNVTYQFIGSRLPVGAVVPESEEWKALTEYTFKNPGEYEGFTFSGWTVKTPFGLNQTATSIIMPDSDVLLTGYWIKDGEKPVLPDDDEIIPGIPHKIFYYANDGTNNMTSVEYLSGQQLAIPKASTFFDVDMKFMGWALNGGTSIIEYTAYQQITMPNHDIVLYAVWDKTAPPVDDDTEYEEGGELPWGDEDNGNSGENRVSITYYANNYTGDKEIEYFGYSATVKLIDGEEEFEHNGLEFIGWSENRYASEAEYSVGDEIKLTSAKVLYGIWRESGYKTNDIIDENSVNIDIDGDGRPDINIDRNNDGIIDEGSPRSEEEYWAMKQNLLNKKDHFAYVAGYVDGTFGPDKNITRAEAAAIFYRLLNDQEYTTKATYGDVKDTDWFSDAVYRLSELGIIAGYPNGNFGPYDYITKAEFTVIASRFDRLEVKNTSPFIDTVGHWAESYIESAVNKGWVSAGNNGYFYPDSYIKRAEVVSIVNKVLGRSADRDYVVNNNLNKFSDINYSHWAFWDIVEAAYGHNYTSGDYGEKWLSIDG